MSFETWSKHSTRPALKSSWMLFSITPTKETNSGRFSVSKASITALTICWIHRTSTFIRTVPAAATHSTAITPSQRNSSSTVCVTGFEIRTLMDSVLMRDRFCRVGFTMNDLVSYNAKHNEANGEDNRDGINDNLSWNCGAGGEAHDSSIETLRERQIKNFATLLMLSRGVPMILVGDEIRRTQM